MIILISPAKKQLSEPARAELPQHPPRWPEETRTLAGIMAEYDAPGLMALMKISADLAQLNVARYREFHLPHTPADALQAALAFQGDTYVGLESAGFSPPEWAFAERHLRILSGLYGLLGPLDLVQPHRLEMGTRLPNPRGNTLYDFWGERVTEGINADLAASGGDTVVNLASQEYFKAVRPRRLSGRLITPVFKERRGEKLQVIGTRAKRARGAMARFIIQQGLTTPEGIQGFQALGYRFHPALSSSGEWVFVAG